jgi:nitrogen-specific signal transduction histidine kinase
VLDLTHAPMIITYGAVAFGLLAFLWGLRVSDGARGAVRRWRERAADLEEKLARSDSVFSAHPGVVLIWEDEQGLQQKDLELWGKPRVYGSPLALASMFRLSDASTSPDAAQRILEGLADLEARDVTGAETTLRRTLKGLRAEGAPFSLTIMGPSGRFLEADGRTAGARAVLWLTDSTIKGIEESGARGRLEEARLVVSRDPTAFYEMVHKAPFAAWRLSSGLKLMWANKAYLHAVEVKSLDQALQRSVLLGQPMAEVAKKVLEGGQELDEVRHMVVRGERRAIRLVMFPVSGGVSGMGFDVTEEESAREDLAKHVRAHDQTLDRLADAVAIFGPDKRLIFHNAAFAKLFGLDVAFLADRPSHSAILDKLRDTNRLPQTPNYARWRAEELALYQEVGDIPETQWTLPAGRTLRVVRQRHPLGGVLLIFSDRTTELTLESSFRQALRVQRAALDKLSEGIAVFGADGQMRLHNEALRDMWALEKGWGEQPVSWDMFVGRATAMYAQADAWNQLRYRITDLSPERRNTYRTEFSRADGKTLAVMSQPLPDGATLIVFDDITADRNFTTALQDRQRALEAADRLKDTFIRNMSYQLRTPLQSIAGYAELLQLPGNGPLERHQQEQVHSILEGAGQLTKLVNDIIDLTMIIGGDLELERAPHRLPDLVAEAMEYAMPRALHGKITIRQQIAPNLPALNVDGRRITQILVNLLSNSLRFTGPGGTVEIGAERAQDGGVRLWVQDTGRGIDPEMLGKVFDDFESGDQRGAGLGLTLVKLLVERHDGWVSADSEPGKGTRVECWFPAGALVAKASATAAA